MKNGNHSQSGKQSTDHLLMIEPVDFHTNSETTETNPYQARKDEEPAEVISQRAVTEFRAYRDALVENGVKVTTALGHSGSPDMVFPNWASVSSDGSMILYPMLCENRQKERRPDIIDMLAKTYPKITDWSKYEKEGKFLESTASIVSDHLAKVGYCALSKRTNPELANKWARHKGYEIEIFETRSHTGIPVYHTDYLMYIGTEMAAICTPCILPEYRGKVLDRLSQNHEVIELSMEQLKANCGNALEVIGAGGQRMLTMSKAALEAMKDSQLAVIEKYYKNIITASLGTLEKYGGGSARCMLMELF